jgi:hypothetical protein
MLFHVCNCNIFENTLISFHTNHSQNLRILELNDTTIYDHLIGKDVKGRGPGIIEGTIPEFDWED